MFNTMILQMAACILTHGTSPPMKVAGGRLVHMARKIVMNTTVVRTGKHVVDNEAHTPRHRHLHLPVGTGIRETIGTGNLALTISGTAMVPAAHGKDSTSHLTVWYTITNGFVFLSCGTCIVQFAVCDFCTLKTWYEWIPLSFFVDASSVVMHVRQMKGTVDYTHATAFVSLPFCNFYVGPSWGMFPFLV